MTFREVMYAGYLGRYYLEHFQGRPAPLYYGVMIGVLLLFAVIPYFIGCLNFGIIISGAKYHEDIRTKGSGNAGATNMLRTYGKKMAAITFAGDFLKAAVSVVMGICLFGGIGGYIAAFACMVGHAFPCFYGFKGGKGVAVSAASILFLDWRIFLILLICFVLIVWWTKYISLGSVTCLFMFPLLLSRMNDGRMPSIVVVIAFMMSALVIYLHRENIKRIYSGKESKVSFRSKKSDESSDDR